MSCFSIFSYDQRNTQNHLKLCTFYVECKNWFVDITKNKHLVNALM